MKDQFTSGLIPNQWAEALAEGCEAGAAAFTALRIAKVPSNKGMSCCFLNWIPATKFHMKSGRKLTYVNWLRRDGARVAAAYDYDDVLLRRRA